MGGPAQLSDVVSHPRDGARNTKKKTLEQVPAVLNRGIPIARGWAESWRAIRFAEARYADILFVGFAGTGDRSG
jgi:hypothetical protein